MDRGSLLRWVFIGLAVFLFVKYGWPLITGESDGAATTQIQPLGPADDAAPTGERPNEATCLLEGPRFSAEVTSKGASLKHAWMQGKYTLPVDGSEVPIDLVTTEREGRLPLRTNLKTAGTNQVDFNDLDWQLDAKKKTKTSCTFTYTDQSTLLTKTIKTTEEPFELAVTMTVENKADEARSHRLSIEQSAYRTAEETSGSLGRVAEWTTRAAVYANGETTRWEIGDFDADEFDEPEFTDEKWRRAEGTATWAAVSSSYFSKAIIHVDGPAEPFGESLIEEVWHSAKYPNKDDDPAFGHVYRARLAYPVHELAKDQTANYEWVAFVGPKEREVLATVGGTDYHTSEIIDLGMFGAIGKLLIQYLYFLFGFVGTWGWAICLLTITVKLLLFPLSLAQIKSSYAMRKLKPEMDELNAKFKDDAQARGIALQKLWRENKVANPMLGCLPVMLQMPVWFALYTSLQTAVELYHTPFGPFIPDLSAPGLYYIIPALLGASSFLQQRLMPMQGDAAQQKMMRWMMPAIFTVMMLFLPAGLGIYFLTNTWLGIGQQLAIERFYKSREAAAADSASDEQKDEDEDDSGDVKSRAMRKGKARV